MMDGYIIVKPNEVADALGRGLPVLAEVLSPLARAMEFRVPLTAMLRENPLEGQAELDRLVAISQEDIDMAILAGADGILYRVRGAEPEYTTPMEYGGFYLECERDLLTPVAESKTVVIAVEGGPEVYMDALSDLPGKIVRAKSEGSAGATHPAPSNVELAPSDLGVSA